MGVLKIFSAAILPFLFSINSFSQNKKIYPVKGPDNGIYLNGNSFVYKPGDTLVLKSGNGIYSYFSLENFHGTEHKPVVIINEGGVVNMTDGMAFRTCSFIKATGTGSTGDKYGFHIESPVGGVGVNVFGRSSDIELNNFFIHNKTYGFWVKQEADCDTALQFPHWVINNISIHDNKIVHMGQEGMYLGSTDPNGTRKIMCNDSAATPIPLRLGNMKIYNNLVDSTNRSGIQLSGADSGANEIYNNTISNCGYELNDYQGNGISLGGFTHAYVHDNNIKNTYAIGIFVLGSGFTRVENNIIDSSGYLGGHTIKGMAGIMVDTRPTSPVDSSLVYIKNNKIGVNTDYAIRFYKTVDTYKKGNLIINNTGTIKVADGIDWSDGKGAGSDNNLPVKDTLLAIAMITGITLFLKSIIRDKK